MCVLPLDWQFGFYILIENNFQWLQTGGYTKGWKSIREKKKTKKKEKKKKNKREKKKKNE